MCALERVVTTAREELRPGVDVAVHVIEPGTPGLGGLRRHAARLSPPQQSVRAALPVPVRDRGLPALLRGRAVRLGRGDGLSLGRRPMRVDPAGQPIEPHHFLPRRLMGEYLQWFYRALVAGAPPSVHIVHHPTSAVDLVARRDKRGGSPGERRRGRRRPRDRHVRPHGEPARRALPRVQPVPSRNVRDRVPTGAKVAVSGMGLVAVDVVTALTVGRDGRFVEDGAGCATAQRPGAIV